MLPPQAPTPIPPSPPWQQGEVFTVTIEDLSDNGDGVGRLDQRVVFVPDTAPGDRVRIRLTHGKARYGFGKVEAVLDPSPHRIRPRCIVADKCGGCQWQHLSDDYQGVAKYHQVVQAMERIGRLPSEGVAPVLTAPSPLGYRNKALYPVGLSPTRQVKVGYYRKGSHQLINLNQCPVQDPRLNPFLEQIKADIQAQGWTIYNEHQHRGHIRHLGLRLGRRTGEVLLMLVVREWGLGKIEEQAQRWLAQYPDLVGVVLNRNPHRTNAILGEETRCVAGRPYVREVFAGLQLHIHGSTFFQVYTEQAEVLLGVILQGLQLQGTETIVDAYCGIGTLSLPLAQRAGQVLGLEVQQEAVDQARENALLNGIKNAVFRAGDVADLLPTLGDPPDIVVLDPPRKGCEARFLTSLLALNPPRIVYVSCKPSTLARDLRQLCGTGQYRMTALQPVDFFPQTAHVECVAFLERSPGETPSPALG